MQKQGLVVHFDGAREQAAEIMHVPGAGRRAASAREASAGAEPFCSLFPRHIAVGCPANIPPPPAPTPRPPGRWGLHPCCRQPQEREQVLLHLEWHPAKPPTWGSLAPPGGQCGHLFPASLPAQESPAGPNALPHIPDRHRLAVHYRTRQGDQPTDSSDSFTPSPNQPCICTHRPQFCSHKTHQPRDNPANSKSSVILVLRFFISR